MADPFYGEIRMFGGNFAPVGWAFCDGSVLPISEYVELFSLIGTTYGGDGQTTFALPDLRGRAIVSQGQGPGLAGVVIGEAGGSETVTLSVAQIPPHGIATSASPSTSRRPKQALAKGGSYAPLGAANGAMHSVGGSQTHPNMPPFLTLSFIICLFGIYPSQN